MLRSRRAFWMADRSIYEELFYTTASVGRALSPAAVDVASDLAFVFQQNSARPSSKASSRTVESSHIKLPEIPILRLISGGAARIKGDLESSGDRTGAADSMPQTPRSGQSKEYRDPVGFRITSRRTFAERPARIRSTCRSGGPRVEKSVPWARSRAPSR